MKMPEIDIDGFECNHGSPLCTYAKCDADCESCAICDNDNMKQYIDAVKKCKQK